MRSPARGLSRNEGSPCAVTAPVSQVHISQWPRRQRNEPEQPRRLEARVEGEGEGHCVSQFELYTQLYTLTIASLDYLRMFPLVLSDVGFSRTAGARPPGISSIFNF